MTLATYLFVVAFATALTSARSCDASSLITEHEGSRSCSYEDTTGHRTVGVGFNMDAVSESTWNSILPGVSYHDVYSGKTCLTSGQIHTLLEYSMKDAIAESRRVVSNYESMCCNVQNVVTDMTFNLGSLSGFHTLVGYFERGDYADAAQDMKGTLWCRQVGRRCTEDAEMVSRGCGSGPSPPGPSPPPSPTPSGGCKTCLENGGGKGCLPRCKSCGSACTTCIEFGGGKGCVERCCDNEAPEFMTLWNFGTNLLDLILARTDSSTYLEHQCCFCSNGGDGSGACFEKSKCDKKGGGYTCKGTGSGGCHWVNNPGIYEGCL